MMMNKRLWSTLMVGALAGAGCLGMEEQAAVENQEVKNNSSTVQYSGQGLLADGFGGYDLITELCGVANGADAEGPYLLWVLSATQATSATITILGTTYTMTPSGNGTFKYVSSWYDPDSLLAPGAVSATYQGKITNAQLVISHGCRPFNEESAWCSPGYWRNATAGAYALIGVDRFTALFNATVYDGFYGATFLEDPTLDTVLTTSGGTYKGPGVPGTLGYDLNAFNATGAYLTEQIPGYTFTMEAMLQNNDSDTCPIDHHGNWKNPQ
jgi:hypothetical protein